MNNRITSLRVRLTFIFSVVLLWQLSTLADTDPIDVFHPSPPNLQPTASVTPLDTGTPTETVSGIPTRDIKLRFAPAITSTRISTDTLRSPSERVGEQNEDGQQTVESEVNSPLPLVGIILLVLVLWYSAGRKTRARKREIRRLQKLLYQAEKRLTQILTREEVKEISSVRKRQRDLAFQLPLASLKGEGIGPGTIEILSRRGINNIRDVDTRLSQIQNYRGIGPNRIEQIENRIEELIVGSSEQAYQELCRSLGTLTIAEAQAVAKFNRDVAEASYHCEYKLKQSGKDKSSSLDVRQMLDKRWPNLLNTCEEIQAAMWHGSNAVFKDYRRTLIIELLLDYGSFNHSQDYSESAAKSRVLSISTQIEKQVVQKDRSLSHNEQIDLEHKKREISEFRSKLVTAWHRCQNLLNESENQSLTDIEIRYQAKLKTIDIDLLRGNGLGVTTIKRLRQDGITNISMLARNDSLLSGYRGFTPNRLGEVRKRIDFLESRTLQEVCRDAEHSPWNLRTQALFAFATFKHHYARALSQCDRLLGESDIDKWLALSVKDELHSKWSDLMELCEKIVMSREQEVSKGTGEHLDDRTRIVDLLIAYCGVDLWKSELDERVLAAIDSIELLDDDFAGELRPYQVFGARFALAQRRVILGDEMGLGKTAQAIGVICHLKSLLRRKLSILIIVPATLVENWRHELEHFTKFHVTPLRGTDLTGQCSAFIRNGGIGIISYSALSRNTDYVRGNHHDSSGLFGSHHFDLLILDEAHYIKNSDSQRTRHARILLEQGDNVIMLTGTPVENHLDDMMKLVGYLNPKLQKDIEVDRRQQGEMLPSEFMRKVAPVYLRRRTIDVLHELPEKIEKVEWTELTHSDWKAYKQAESYHVLRQSASIGDGEGNSSKLDFIKELLTYYEETREKVIVFTFYLSVIEYLKKKLKAENVITGQVAMQKRTQVLDSFTKRKGHDLLLAQINSAGTGLNIQAASAVILVEPQFKPSIENQAIARAYRMGQSRKVKVHRIIASNTVDELILARNDEKARQFRLYADDSIVKHLTADSVKSEFDFAKAVMQIEKTRHQHH